jgi:hypothetical protein
MDLNKFTIRSQQPSTGADHCRRAEGQQVETGHLLKGLLEVDKDVSALLIEEAQREHRHACSRRWTAS